MNTISVIIPYYNNWFLTHSRLGELQRFVPDPLEIILVNDASPDLDCHTMPAFWQKLNIQHEIKYVRNQENLGFGGSHNRGAKAATGDILVFLSNDVVMSGNIILPISQTIKENNGEVIVGGKVLYYDTGWNTLMLNGKPSIIPYPEGWLIVCTRDVWKRIGGWDAKTYGRYDFEDVDIGAWAMYNDMKIVGLNLPFVNHLFGQTVSLVTNNREAQTKINQQKFRNKWTEKLQAKFGKG